MTSNYHTPIATGAAANASSFNDALGQMDEALTEALLLERDGHIIQDESIDVTQQARIDFRGGGVTLTNEPGKTVVTIPSTGTDINGAVLNATPADTVRFGFYNTATSLLNYLTLANFKALLKTYFDTLYSAIGAIPSDGWIPFTATLTYSSADAPSYVISANADITSLLKVGMRIKLTHLSTVKYFLVTAVGSYSAGATLFTVYGGTDYTLTNSALTLGYYSPVKCPAGFPMAAEKWTVVVTDTSDRTQASPVAGTYYQPGTLSITVPIGSWRIGCSAVLSCSVTDSQVSMQILLSTTTNSVTDAQLLGYQVGFGSTVARTQQTFNRLLTLASKATYNLLVLTGTAGVSSIGILPASSGVTTKIYAESTLL